MGGPLPLSASSTALHPCYVALQMLSQNCLASSESGFRSGQILSSLNSCIKFALVCTFDEIVSVLISVDLCGLDSYSLFEIFRDMFKAHLRNHGYS